MLLKWNEAIEIFQVFSQKVELVDIDAGEKVRYV